MFEVPADAYGRFMGRYAEPLAPGFADFAGVRGPASALDVGWTSASGTAHEGGRPACLPPTGDVGPVELSWVPVTTDGRSWRQVVWVTC